VILEATRLILSLLSNDLDIAHLKKFEHLEINVLEHHPVKIKAFGGHLVECLQNILANDFGENLNKLNY